MKNIIFLDFDGVLNDMYYSEEEETYEDKEYHKMYFKLREFEKYNVQDSYKKLFRRILDLDVEKVLLLNEMVLKTDCYFVLSTSWRSDEECLLYLVMRGFKYPERVLGITPFSKEYQSRGMEISSWISNNGFNGKYLILDDEMFDFNKTHKDKYLIVKGLNDADFENIIKFFDMSKEN